MAVIFTFWVGRNFIFFSIYKVGILSCFVALFYFHDIPMCIYNMWFQWYQIIWKNIYINEYHFITLTNIYDWKYNWKNANAVWYFATGAMIIIYLPVQYWTYRNIPKKCIQNMTSCSFNPFTIDQRNITFNINTVTIIKTVYTFHCVKHSK